MRESPYVSYRMRPPFMAYPSVGDVGKGGFVLFASFVWGQGLTVVTLAIALGMDAFSLCLGMGMQRWRRRDMMRISAWVAFFHMVMPLIGCTIGRMAGNILGDVAVWVGGGILIALGAQMAWQAWQHKQTPAFDLRAQGAVLLFALSVSVDSLSAGITLGVNRAQIGWAVGVMGVFGGGLSWLGLVLGGRIGRMAGEYGQGIGGILVMALGVGFVIGA